MDLGDGATIVLAILTGFYVYFTWRLNQNAAKSATSAETSATAAETSATASQAATEAARDTAVASQRAAEAAERSAALSEAAIAVDFTAHAFSAGERTLVRVRSVTASVYVFSIHVRLLVVPESGGVREISGTTTMTGDDGAPALYVHRGEEALAFISERLNAGDTVIGHGMVSYGFQTEPTARERQFLVESQTIKAAV